MFIKRAIRSALCTLCISFISYTNVSAAEREVTWYVSPVISSIQTDSARPTQNDAGFGLGFGFRPSNWWALEIFGNGDTLYAQDGIQHFYQRGLSLDLFGFPYRYKKLELYGVAGVGGLRTTHLGNKTVNLMANAGLGFQTQLTRWGLAVRADVRYRFDNDVTSMANQKGFGDVFLNLGLSIPLGTVFVVENSRRGNAADILSQSSDNDKDGIADIIDLCPTTHLGVPVDARGCELDSDGDGIVDSRDQCANSSPQLKVTAFGCEFDSDFDGLADSKDSCPNSKVGAAVDASGCEFKRQATFKAETINSAEHVTPFNINFETNSAYLDVESKHRLEKLALSFKKNPNAVLVLTGHTDITGSVEHNKVLAANRSNTVSQFLKNRGISPKRLITDAKGPFEPVADNRTEKGRAENRRVEMFVMDQ